MFKLPGGIMLLVCLALLGIIVVCAVLLAINKKRTNPSMTGNFDTMGSINSVRAMVVDKYTTQPTPNTYGNFTPVGYVVVFQVGNERLAFNVSEYSFNNYMVNMSGILRFSGNAIVDFTIN